LGNPALRSDVPGLTNVELLPAFTTVDLLLRLGAATAAGSLVGLNRDLRHKPAGMRTHALVSIGSAGITLLAMAVAWDGSDIPERRAITQVLQGIITGIGFLGAGVIVRDLANKQVHGLTTAATIWLAAAFGMVFGAAYWSVGAIMVLLTFAILVLGEFVENATLKIWNQEEPDEQEREGNF
jgi:putative Mg2+ transporter-C (MgtC) family protein